MSQPSAANPADDQSPVQQIADSTVGVVIGRDNHGTIIVNPPAPSLESVTVAHLLSLVRRNVLAHNYSEAWSTATEIIAREPDCAEARLLRAVASGKGGYLRRPELTVGTARAMEDDLLLASADATVACEALIVLAVLKYTFDYQVGSGYLSATSFGELRARLATIDLRNRDVALLACIHATPATWSAVLE